MFYLLLLFSLVTLGAGVFLIGFGIPIRETVFGSALLVSGTVALVGTFLLVGLAFAVRELQRVVHGVRRMPGPRPPRPVERKEGERRPPAQRPASPRAGADAPIPPPTSIDEAPYEAHAEARLNAGASAQGVRGEPEARPDPRAPARRPGPEWLRRAISEIEPVPGEPPPEPVAHHPDPRHYDEQPRRHGSGDIAFGRPSPPGPERPQMQEGWSRPRGGPPAPIDPEDYAPVPHLPIRQRMPPAEARPPHEREPEPVPDQRMRPRGQPAHQLEPPREGEPETLPYLQMRGRMPPAAQFEPPPGYEREPEPAPDFRMRARMPSAPQPEPTPSHEYEPEPVPDLRMRARMPPAPPPDPAPMREPEVPRQPPALPPNLFDTVWPSERRPAPAPERPHEPQPPPSVRPGETRPLPPVQHVPMPGPAPVPPMAAPRPEPPHPEARPQPPRIEQRPEPFRPEPPRHEPARHEPIRPEPVQTEPIRSEPRPLSVLKSGVIDEMAYTLFTDGSIEAQLPDGTMRFASIEELRRHLDQNG
jgi:hypothetical protein